MSFVFEADSSVVLSIILELTTISQIRKKIKKSSPVWAYTRMPLENENSDLFYYFYYEQDLIVKRAPYDSESSSAMITYINRCYPLIIIEKATNKK
jgi:hypothetical protein